ncbi:hypothetical protein [Rhizobium gallicum]|uniref:hypothetical protein n=1 Tax=Rhizobium gallicum TaxID=56730 RepID=UPI001EF953AC|nr:hypothetical protein [Rhizobium gallicum]ULJ74406.1 hypothetical protein L2W42_21230 [Rhizobium gallicum]
MFLVDRFKFLISNFIVELLNFLADNAAEAAEKIGKFEVSILSRLCGSHFSLTT